MPEIHSCMMLIFFRSVEANKDGRIPDIYLRGYPSWAQVVDANLAMVRSTSQLRYMERVQILDSLSPSLSPHIAKEIVEEHLQGHELPEKFRAKANCVTDYIGILRTCHKYLSEDEIGNVLEKVSEYVYPGILLEALAKFVLAPGSDIYTGLPGTFPCLTSSLSTFRASLNSTTTATPSKSKDICTDTDLDDMPTSNICITLPSSPQASSSYTHHSTHIQQPQDRNEVSNGNLDLFHSYCVPSVTDSSSCTPSNLNASKKFQPCRKVSCSNNRKLVKSQQKTIKSLVSKLSDKEHQNQLMADSLVSVKQDRDTMSLDLRKVQQELQLQAAMNIDQIKHSNSLMNLHTGLPTYNLFMYVYELVEEPASTMQYWRGSSTSSGLKDYQVRNKKKPGRSHQISLQNQLLMTLMKVRLNVTESHLAFLFKVQESSVSKIVTTWLLLLNQELKPLIYWPSVQEVLKDQPACFAKWGGRVRAIIDCTEVPIQRPSLAEANTKTFSNYKNTTTIKYLIACTPQGTISYVSPPAGGRMSDITMVEKCRLAELFAPGDICMADKGFRIQHLLLDRSVELVIPPFTKQGKQFTEGKNKRNKEIANARIHIERVIGRMKDFKLFQGPIPINFLDLTGAIANVCAALVNLNEPLVPLE